MELSPHAQAILLLTVSFKDGGGNAEKPLSRKEWARFAKWLNDHKTTPLQLLEGDVSTLLDGMVDKTVSPNRIERLFERGAALGLCVEKWSRVGIWAMTRSDPDYPKILKERLKYDSPAVLFGCGSKKLLQNGGLAVVGSRHASEDDLAFTSSLGKITASEGHSIISGGARGVDQQAMLATLEEEGTAVGVLADSLLRESTSRKYHKKIISGDLVLVSPFNPEAGFNVGHAMERNKYIYALADAAVIVSSTTGKGGTWSGAIEVLDAGWIPVWAKQSNDASSGNHELAKLGASLLPDQGIEIEQLFKTSVESDGRQVLFPKSNDETCKDEHEVALISNSQQNSKFQEKDSSPLKPTMAIDFNSSKIPNLFECFLFKFQEISVDEALKADEISNRLDIKKTQVTEWLARAVDEGKIAKLQKPVRYQFVASSTDQASLL